MFVFSELVAVQINSTWKFFPYPIIAMNYVKAIPFNQEGGDGQFDKFDQILGYGMIESEENNVKVYNLYAVTNTTLVKIAYWHDSEMNVMMLLSVEKSINEGYELDGNLVRSMLSQTDFVVSCADCTKPSVQWYDHKLNLVNNKAVNQSTTTAYELAVYDQTDGITIQTFITSNETIQIVLEVHNWLGKHYYQEEEPYRFQGMSDGTQVSIGKGLSYLVWKQSNEPFLKILPVCENDAKFDPQTKACLTCTEGLRSWGLQDNECVSCAAIWLKGKDYFTWTLYEELCSIGNTKSSMLMVFVPIISVALTCLICWRTRDNGLKGLKMFKQSKLREGKQRPIRGYNRARPRREQEPSDDEEIQVPKMSMEFGGNDQRLQSQVGAEVSKDWKEAQEDSQNLEG